MYGKRRKIRTVEKDAAAKSQQKRRRKGRIPLRPKGVVVFSAEKMLPLPSPFLFAITFLSLLCLFP